MAISEPAFHSTVGAPCQMRHQGAHPVWCITTLRHSEILFSNVATGPRRWVITGGTVYSQRFWASSTATIHLSCSLPTVHDVPPELPLYTKVKKNDDNTTIETTHKFQPETELCIWAGYLPTLRPITPEDLKESRLLRIYVGVVDTISTVGTPKGISMTIQCRDRMRYLQDTEVSFDPSFSGDSSSDTLVQAFSRNAHYVRRSDLILKVSQLGIGYVAGLETLECNINGRVIKPAFIQDLGYFVSFNEPYYGDNPPQATGPIGEGAKSVVNEALSWVGRHFNPGKGAQCAFFVNAVFDRAGHPMNLSLPGLASSCHNAGPTYRTSDINTIPPGAIVSYQNTYNGPGAGYGPRASTHVGVAIGGGEVVDRPTRSAPVKRRRIDVFRPDNNGQYRYIIPNVLRESESQSTSASTEVTQTEPTSSTSTAPTQRYVPRGGRLGVAERVQADPQGAAAIRETAKKLGLDPIEFAALISLESAGTFNPNVDGGLFRNGAYQCRGLIQFCLGNRATYGITGTQTIAEQMPAVYRYFIASGFVPGRHNLINAYATVLAGSPNKVNASDTSNGGAVANVTHTVKTRMMPGGDHYASAAAFMQRSGEYNGPLPGFGSGGGGSRRGGGIFTIEDLTGKLYPIDFFYRCTNDHSNETIPCRARTENPEKLLDLDDEMKFNIITGRLPFTNDTISKDFTVEQQIPIEFIRFMSAQEPYPTEVFQNHLDGNFYYSPRVNDVSGLADSRRFFRTYYFRTIPADIPKSIPKPSFESQLPEVTYKQDDKCEPIAEFDYEAIFAQVDYCQMMINFKEELSSLGMKTNFLIANQSPTGTTAGQALVMHMAARPAFLRGEEIGGRNAYIIDQSITSIGEAAAVAASVARLHAKELRSASMTVIGDPSLTPGELIQIVNSPLHHQDMQTYVDERESIREYEAVTRSHYMSALEVTRQGIASRAEESAPLTGNYSAEDAPDSFERVDDDYEMRARQADFKSSADDLFCSVTEHDTATVAEKDGGWEGDNYWRKSGFTQDPRSVWRIEGVRHTLNSGGQQGWTTEVVLLSPY